MYVLTPSIVPPLPSLLSLFPSSIRFPDISPCTHSFHVFSSGCNPATVVSAGGVSSISSARGCRDADEDPGFPGLYTCQRRFPGRFGICCNPGLQAPGDEQLSCQFSALLPTGKLA